MSGKSHCQGSLSSIFVDISWFYLIYEHFYNIACLLKDNMDDLHVTQMSEIHEFYNGTCENHIVHMIILHLRRILVMGHTLITMV